MALPPFGVKLDHINPADGLVLSEILTYMSDNNRRFQVLGKFSTAKKTESFKTSLIVANYEMKTYDIYLRICSTYSAVTANTLQTKS